MSEDRINIDGIKKILWKYGQTQLLKYFNDSSLTEEQRNSLLRQISIVDFEKLDSTFGDYQTALQFDDVYSDLKPLEDKDVIGLESLPDEEQNMYEDLALEELANERVALFLLAGGQGTRMKLNYNKGIYNIKLPSEKCLFQLHCERISHMEGLIYRKYHKVVHIPLFIMTSNMNNKQTKLFFEQHSYFGLLESQVQFFVQGYLPCTDDQGKVLLYSKWQITISPEGNGGFYGAIQKHHILEQLKQRNIKHVYVAYVDNATVQLPDPLFIGYCISQKVQLGVKCLPKTCPEEKLGIMLKKQKTDESPDYHSEIPEGRLHIVEYNLFTYKNKCFRDHHCNLVYKYGYAGIMYFSADFLYQMVSNKLASVYHIANKPVPYFDELLGRTINPIYPNGYKCESFIFDAFTHAESYVCVNTRRYHFTPIKNLPGIDCLVDSANQARTRINQEHYQWLIRNQVNVIGELQETWEDLCYCEISPLISRDGDSLSNLKQASLSLPLQIIDKSELLFICKDIDIQHLFDSIQNPSEAYSEINRIEEDTDIQNNQRIQNYLQLCPPINEAYVTLPQLVKGFHIYIRL
ncbi:hypothetical protein WA158_002212 [Blastocystis sp. Blastoise]